MLGWLVRLTGERAEAEDILQETFLRLFEARGSYREEGRFRAWLFTVATRLAYDRGRNARRRDALGPVALRAVGPAPAGDPSLETEARDLAARVESALADLSPEHARAFHLRVREGLSYREIAGITGDPEGTLRSRVHHALRRVRSLIEPEMPSRVAGPRGKENQP